MKLHTILKEGVEFNACSVETKNGRRRISPHGMRQEKIPCSVCDGSGKEKYGKETYPCMLCDGKGTITDTVCDGPSLQVSNVNAEAIVNNVFGEEFDYAGVIEKDQLPELRRKLIKMINSPKQRTSMHRDTVDNDKDRQMQKTGVRGNVTQIGKAGARVVDIGRSDPQVLRYAQRLLAIIEYAMKHDLVLSWA